MTCRGLLIFQTCDSKYAAYYLAAVLLAGLLRLYRVEFMAGSTELATPPLRFDNGLIARPEEIPLADGFHQPTALHHLSGIVVQTCEHERTALFVQPLMQTVDGFNACCIDQRHAAH